MAKTKLRKAMFSKDEKEVETVEVEKPTAKVAAKKEAAIEKPAPSKPKTKFEFEQPGKNNQSRKVKK